MPGPREDVIDTRVEKAKPFTIITGADQQVVHGRGDAVDAAKRASRQTPRTVHVERDDGRVSMEFRRGRLEAYRYDTRPPRRRS